MMILGKSLITLEWGKSHQWKQSYTVCISAEEERGKKGFAQDQRTNYQAENNKWPQQRRISRKYDERYRIELIGPEPKKQRMNSLFRWTKRKADAKMRHLRAPGNKSSFWNANTDVHMGNSSLHVFCKMKWFLFVLLYNWTLL